MIPILMAVFALGGTTFGMAEESLAFYALIITVMIAAGYDALVGAVDPPARLRDRRARLDDQPVRDRHRLGLRRRRRSSEGIVGRLVILVVGTAIGIVFVLRYARRVKADPSRSLVVRREGRERGPASSATGDAASPTAALTGRQKVVLVAVLPRLRRDDLRRHPVGGPRHRAAHAVVVVPRDDGLVPAVRDPHRASPAGCREAELHRRPSSTAPATCSASR